MLPIEFKKPGIYRLRCPHNNKCYVGSSSNIRGRWEWHKRDLHKGTHDNRLLLADWIKYGPTSFKVKIIEVFNGSKEDREKLEEAWIKKLGTTEEEGGYNISLNGRDRTGIKVTDVTILKNMATGQKKHHDAHPERALKVSRSLKGREILWADKVSKSIKRLHRDPKYKKQYMLGRKKIDWENLSEKTAYTLGTRPFVVYNLKGEFKGKFKSKRACAKQLRIERRKSPISYCLNKKLSNTCGYIFFYSGQEPNNILLWIKENVRRRKGAQIRIFKNGKLIGQGNMRQCRELTEIHCSTISRLLSGKSKSKNRKGYTFKYA